LKVEIYLVCFFFSLDVQVFSLNQIKNTPYLCTK